MRLHRLLGINGARRVKTAADDITAPRLEEQPVAFDDDRVVEDDRYLLVRRPGPVT